MNDFANAVDGLLPSSLDTTAVLSPAGNGNDELSSIGSKLDSMLHHETISEMNHGSIAKSTLAEGEQLQFVKGINLGGDAVTVEGQQWLSQSEATSDGLFISPSAQAYLTSGSSSQDADADAAILNSYLQGSKDIEIRQVVDNGTYQVDLWTREPTRSRTFDVQLEGVTVAQIQSKKKGEIQKRSFTTTVEDGSLDVTLRGIRKASIISGIEFSLLPDTQPDVPDSSSPEPSAPTHHLKAEPDTDTPKFSDAFTLSVVESAAADSAVKRLEGGADNDVIVGDSSNNIITGGGGNDRLTGGGGSNTFRYDGPWHSERTDTITDFKPGIDKVDFSALMQKSVHQSGDLADYVRIVEKGGDTHVQFNPKGDKSPEFFRTMSVLAGTTGVTKSDVVLSSSEVPSSPSPIDAPVAPDSGPVIDNSGQPSGDEPMADDDGHSGHGEDMADHDMTPKSGADSGADGGGKNSHHDWMVMSHNGPSMAELESLPRDVRSGFRVQPSSVNLRTGNKGLFRTMSDVSHFNYSDPLINYDDAGAKTHLHMFWGNNFTDGSFVSDAPTFNQRALEVRDMLRSQPSSSGAGGTANLSSYWAPAILDGENEIQIPQQFHTYYKDGGFKSKVGPGENINDLDTLSRTQINMVPNGLRMLAGNPKATSAAEQSDHVAVTYIRKGVRSPSSSTFQEAAKYGRKGDLLEIKVTFPQFWDGKNLDSPDHRSHMSYEQSETHPYALPELSYRLRFANIPYDGFGKDFHLSSDGYNYKDKGGGLSFHGDFMEAWDEKTKQTWTVECLRKKRDCKTNPLGNGQELH